MCARLVNPVRKVHHGPMATKAELFKSTQQRKKAPAAKKVVKASRKVRTATGSKRRWSLPTGPRRRRPRFVLLPMPANVSVSSPARPSPDRQGGPLRQVLGWMLLTALGLAAGRAHVPAAATPSKPATMSATAWAWPAA